MKFYLTLLFILAFWAVPGFSQRPTKQPPAPLIYQAPAKIDLKEFVSKEKNFSIVFPGVPSTAKREMDPAQVSIFSVSGRGTNSTVTVIEFQADLENSRENTFELFKASLLKSTKLKIEAERNVTFDGKPAREFDITEGIKFYKVRIVVSGNRVYELKTDVTNWQILSKYNPERAADFEAESKRFFDSFKLLEAPKNQPVPIDFLGFVQKTTYTNKFFGFSLEFPENWEVDDPLESESEINAGVEALKTEEERFNRALAAAVKEEVVVFGVSHNKGEGQTSENFLVGVLKLPDPQMDSQALLKSTKDFFLQNPNIKLLEDIRNFEKNGVKFSTMTFLTTIQGFKITQRIYSTVRKGYSITFTMSYIEESERAALDKIFESVKFVQ